MRALLIAAAAALGTLAGIRPARTAAFLTQPDWPLELLAVAIAVCAWPWRRELLKAANNHRGTP